jgi:hypothetical protein
MVGKITKISTKSGGASTFYGLYHNIILTYARDENFCDVYLWNPFKSAFPFAPAPGWGSMCVPIYNRQTLMSDTDLLQIETNEGRTALYVTLPSSFFIVLCNHCVGKVSWECKLGELYKTSDLVAATGECDWNVARKYGYDFPKPESRRNVESPTLRRPEDTENYIWQFKANRINEWAHAVRRQTLLQDYRNKW